MYCLRSLPCQRKLVQPQIIIAGSLTIIKGAETRHAHHVVACYVHSSDVERSQAALAKVNEHRRSCAGKNELRRGFQGCFEVFITIMPVHSNLSHISTTVQQCQPQMLSSLEPYYSLKPDHPHPENAVLILRVTVRPRVTCLRHLRGLRSSRCHPTNCSSIPSATPHLIEL